MAQFASISPTALMRLIGTPQAPVVIDVCIDDDFQDDPYLVPTARRCPHKEVGALSPDLIGKRVIVICQKGLKLSHGAAAVMRARGVSAEVLEGGNQGWQAAGLPRLPADALPTRMPGSRWVTRWHPKIDRIACPWLIRRFIDPQAEFLFVPPSEVTAVAEKFEATAFDTVGARWSHDGPRCTFDMMCTGFGLSTPALEKMAEVIRAADTNTLSQVPEAAGLLALSIGLSRGFRDDLAQLEAGMVLYDALYRWARDGQSETHDWQREAAQ
ncbi:chromate resistance protein ChrB domain-containing protein [uncultured Roseobacter sp.]|uniref:chromate resistance protein ChrB domain-containing protein n=1 Tax=uncultured Roseobacter sp. TaxID=114847 RepID=UPI002638ADB9|nr:chromate resistance protein ChrB domain-containing protein [uncultured Roseobacter sp.]